jgi:hypothetical protein
MAGQISGYAHPLYARASQHQGTAFELSRSGGALLRRSIPATRFQDAVGPYPLFSCRDWTELDADLQRLEGEFVSVVLVADPFGSYEGALDQAFSHRRRFKEHFIIELERYDEPSRHHRRELSRALRQVMVEPCDPPSAFLEDWNRLYAELIERHAISGAANFSADSFRLQFETPGLVALRATARGETVGMALWFVQGRVAYYHLAAANQAGYRLGASYALVWAAIERFGGLVDTIDLGGVPGLRDAASGGLRPFKQGWATGSRWAYLCGRILDPEPYAALTAGPSVAAEPAYFPAYRAPRSIP